MRYIDTLTKLKTVHFSGLDNIDIADSLYFCNYKTTSNRKDVWSSIGRILFFLFLTNVSYKKTNEGQIAFIFSNSYKNRKDHYEVFTTLVKLFHSKVFFIPGTLSFHLSNSKYFPYVIMWIHSLSKQFPFKEAIYYSSMLLFGVNNAEYIEKIIKKNRCKSVVVLSDMHLIDSILVQKCNLDGIITITLQHGNFETDEPFVLSKSRYFITYGSYSKNIAIKYGFNPERLLEAGVLKLIGKELPKQMKRINHVEKIGIVLSGKMFNVPDSKLVLMLSDYCQKHNMKLFVKFHPESKESDYPDVDWSKIDAVFHREINSDEFREMIDVAVVVNSTVFFEYIMNLFPIFIFKNDVLVFLPEIEWCKFSAASEFDSLLRKTMTDHDDCEARLKELRTYISGAENISERYKEVISEASGSLQ